MTSRAYTQITRHEALVGNQAMERRFSLFPGDTLSLRQFIGDRGYVEWIEKPAADWAIADATGARHGRNALPEWSESCDELGATLWSVWAGPDLTVRAWCLAFHDLPALARGLTVTPHGAPIPEPLRVTVEQLALRQDGAGILDDTLSRRLPQGTWFGSRAAAELRGAGGVGLLLAACPRGYFELFSPDPALVRVGFDSPADYPDPLRQIVVMVPYTGHPGPASGMLEEALRRLRAHFSAPNKNIGEPPV